MSNITIKGQTTWRLLPSRHVGKSKASKSELMDELKLCRKNSSIIKEKRTNLFERFIVYGLAKIQKIQRDSKYPIACAPEYSRNLLSTCYKTHSWQHNQAYPFAVLVVFSLSPPLFSTFTFQVFHLIIQSKSLFLFRTRESELSTIQVLDVNAIKWH